MDIDIKDTITLSDDNEYVVVSKSSYQENIYYYLIDKNNIKNIKFCVENKENISLIEIKDTGLIQQLLPLFVKSTSESITKEDLALIDEAG